MDAKASFFIGWDMEEKDFSKLWGSNGSVATIADDQYRLGWIYIGDNKPTRAQFNAWQQWSDRKHYWLFMNKLGIDDTAKSAKKLETSRTIKVSGAVKGEAKFDGSDDVEIKTTQNGYEAKKAVDGYEQRPSGVIECWGYVARGAGPINSEVKVQFPKSFLKSCFNIQITTKEKGLGNTGDGGYSIVKVTAKDFSAQLQEFNNITGVSNIEGFFWRAIGE